MDYSKNTKREIPDLATLLNRKKAQTSSEINCISIGTIQSFDSVTQTATITLNFKRVIKGGKPLESPDNEAVDLTINYPILVNCPVVFMNGGGGYLTFPIIPGDTCLVLFCDRDIDLWFTSGLTLAPNSDRMHDLSDGIALIGIKPLSGVISNYNTNGAQLLYGNSIISLEDKIQIKVSTTTLRQALDALCDALYNSVDTDTFTFNAGTKTAIAAAKTLIDGVLK